MKFYLNENVISDDLQKMDALKGDLKKIAKKAGTDNPLFEQAWSKLYNLMLRDRFKDFKIENRFDVRALSLALTSKIKGYENIHITRYLLDQVSFVIPNGSSLFIESLLQFFLSNFNRIEDINSIGDWLIKERKQKKLSKLPEEELLCQNGPTFIAREAIRKQTDFEKQFKYWDLDHYAAGDFMKLAQSVYYVEQLKLIPINQSHPLLDEITKESVRNSRYDENSLIGHVAMRILIDRAPIRNVHESWQNAIIAIAGDPRIPSNHHRYIKWWSQLSIEQNKKVRGWLSKLDLKLFLEALEDFSKSSNDEDMMRMFPSRKHFLEGLHESGAIIHTKLYLSNNAIRYIKKNYKSEHIPDYSRVIDGDRSIIYAELTNGHMIEGSHNCQIWFYKELHSTAPVLQFGTQEEPYRSLTIGLNERMSQFGCDSFAHFTHVPTSYSWQRRSIEALRNLNVRIRPMDVLSNEDYNDYKRIYGVR